MEPTYAMLSVRWPTHPTSHEKVSRGRDASTMRSSEARIGPSQILLFFRAGRAIGDRLSVGHEHLVDRSDGLAAQKTQSMCIKHRGQSSPRAEHMRLRAAGAAAIRAGPRFA